LYCNIADVDEMGRMPNKFINILLSLYPEIIS